MKMWRSTSWLPFEVFWLFGGWRVRKIWKSRFSKFKNREFYEKNSLFGMLFLCRLGSRYEKLFSKMCRSGRSIFSWEKKLLTLGWRMFSMRIIGVTEVYVPLGRYWLSVLRPGRVYRYGYEIQKWNSRRCLFFVISVPCWQDSQAFEKQDHKSWTSRSDSRCLQRGYFGVSHSRGQ